MLHLTIAADRIDCWIRRHIVPCDAPSNVNGARDRYVGLHAIGKSLRDQYDSLAAPVPPPLAALVKQLDEARQPPHLRSGPNFFWTPARRIWIDKGAINTGA